MGSSHSRDLLSNERSGRLGSDFHVSITKLDETLEAERQEEIGRMTVEEVNCFGVETSIWGICAASDEEVFATLTSAVVRWQIGSEPELYAGSVTPDTFVDGHRLLQARYSNLKGIFTSPKTRIIWLTAENSVRKIEGDEATIYAGKAHLKGHMDGSRENALFSDPTHLVELDDTLYVTDVWNHAIRRITSDGYVSTIGSREQTNKDGPLKSCSFYYPRGLCLGYGNSMYMTLTGRRLIKYIDLDNQTLTLIAGGDAWDRDGHKDGPALTEARFQFPRQLCYSPTTDEIIVADTENGALRRIRAGTVWTLPQPVFNTAIRNQPTSITISEAGTLFWGSRIGKIGMMRNFAPPIVRRVELSFETLHLSDIFSDLEITHQATSHRIPLHTGVLKLWNIDPTVFMVLQSFGSLTAINSFVASLYTCNFAPPEITGYDLALHISYFIHIGSLVNMASSLLTWSEWRLWRLASSLASSDLMNLLKIIVNDLNGDKRLLECLCRIPACQTQEVIDNAISHQAASSSIVAHIKDCIHKGVFPNSSLDEITTGPKAWKLQKKGISHFLVKRLEGLVSTLEPNDIMAISISNNGGRMSATTSPRSPRSPRSPKAPKTPKSPRSASPKKMRRNSFTASESTSSSQTSTKWTERYGAPDFEFRIPAPHSEFLSSEPPSSASIKLHSWILYARWTWFQSLVQAGLSEVKASLATLPSDFPPSLFLAIAHYIYCPSLLPSSLSPEDLEYLEANGGMFRILDPEGHPAPEFARFVKWARHFASLQDSKKKKDKDKEKKKKSDSRSPRATS